MWLLQKWVGSLRLGGIVSGQRGGFDDSTLIKNGRVEVVGQRVPAAVVGTEGNPSSETPVT